jgi:hypothetical protein
MTVPINGCNVKGYYFIRQLATLFNPFVTREQAAQSKPLFQSAASRGPRHSVHFVAILIRDFSHHTLRRRCKYYSSAHKYMLFVGGRSCKLSESTGSDYVELLDNIIKTNKSETRIR